MTQTGEPVDVDILTEKADKATIILSNSQTAYERFDLGAGASIEDYKALLYLKRVLLSEDSEILEKQDLVKSKLNQIKNKYL
jgi:hypothetical protein